MGKIRSKWIELTDTFDFTGAVTVPTPTLNPHAATKLYVDSAITNTSTAYKTVDLTYTNTTNLVIQLPDAIDVSTPQKRTDVMLTPDGGSLQDYSRDYTVRTVGSTVFICIDPASTPPVGSFDSGGDSSNPTIGISNKLQSGDTVTVVYTISNSTLNNSTVIEEIKVEDWFGL